MDYSSWQKLKDKFNAQGYLPHRKPGKYPSLRRQATMDLTETSASQSNSKTKKTKKTSQRSEKGKRRKREESEEEEEEEEEESEDNGTDESLSEIEATLPVESPKKKRPSQTTSSQSRKKFKK